MRIFAKIIISTVFLFSTCFVSSDIKESSKSVETEKPEVATQKENSEKPESEKNSGEAKEEKTLRVVGVNDGDTITVFDEENRKQIKIRMATIDAPEYTQPFGKKSRQHLSDLVFKKRITLKSFGKDRYGRLIGEVFLDGKNLNVAQIKNGYAWHYKRHQHQQTPAMRLIYSRSQEEANEKRLGVWQNDNPTPPWNYRKANPRNGDKRKNIN